MGPSRTVSDTNGATMVKNRNSPNTYVFNAPDPALEFCNGGSAQKN